MILKEVTSLADLIFKAKSNKLYFQMLLRGYVELTGKSWCFYRGKETNEKTINEVIETLIEISKCQGFYYGKDYNSTTPILSTSSSSS